MPNRNMTIRQAASLQLMAKYINLIIQIATLSVLARLISPQQFGTVAIVTIFVGLFTLVGEMGIGTAIVQYHNLNERDYGALFGFSLVLAMLLCVIFGAVAPVVSWFYGDRNLLALLLWSLPTLFFSAINMVPNGLMLKELRFFEISIRTVVVTIVGGLVAILLALADFAYAALIMQYFITASLLFFWNIRSRKITNISFDFWPSLKKIARYSSYQFGFNLVNYGARNLDNVLIGKFFGVAPLGIYDKAYKLTTFPLTAFASVISSVIQPFMASEQATTDQIYAGWLKLTKLMSLLGVFITTVAVCCAPEIISIVYGPTWKEAIPLFMVLGLSIYCQMMGNPTGAFFQSLGRTDLQFKVSIINTTVTILGLTVGIYHGSLLSVTCGIVVSYFVHLAVLAHFLVRVSFQRKVRSLVIFIPEIMVGLATMLFSTALNSIITFNQAFTGLGFKLVVCISLILVGYKITGQLDNIKSLIHRQSRPMP